MRVLALLCALYLPSQCMNPSESANRVVLDPKKSVNRIVLDLENVDPELFYTYTGVDLNVPLKSYTPKNCAKITAVVENDQEIWRASEKEKARTVVFYSHYGYKLLNIDIDNGMESEMKSFEKVDDKWESTTENNINRRLGRMKRKSLSCTLDISSVDRTRISTKKESLGIPTITYTPKGERYIIAILEDKSPIWVGEYGKECASVTLCKRGGLTLLSMCMREEEQMYYENRPGLGWIRVEKAEHRSKYVALLAGETFE